MAEVQKKSELVQAAHTELDGEYSKVEIREVMDALVKGIQAGLRVGQKVSVLGLVNLTPVGLPARTVMSFGEPKRKGREIKVKAKAVTAATSVLPSPNSKVGKVLVEEGIKRAEGAAKRRAKREKEEAKAEGKAAKSEGDSKKKSSSAKKRSGSKRKKK
jgi:nucleoid DNA-binding protein